MANPFGKRPAEWLRLPSTVSFLETLGQYGKIPQADNQLVKTTKGGIKPGTWFHKYVAMEFARWISPAFAIYTNRVRK